MIKLLLVYLCFSILVACGGGDPITAADDTEIGDTETDDLIVTGPITNVSFMPLMTLEVYKDWSGFDSDNVFRSYGKPTFIKQYLISPVNATTLAPIDTAVISDFDLTEDSIPLNPMVNFPIMQKVVGNSVLLKTAIIINTSSAMDGVDRLALINEVNTFINDAKSHTDSRISNQVFTVWGFDGAALSGEGGIIEETGGFKNTISTAQAAVNTVSTKWASDAYEISGANHTYDAIVEAIGRYVGDGPFKTTEILRDELTLDNNDIDDYLTPDRIDIGNIIVFSSGRSSVNRFDSNFLIKAMESQALLAFDTDSGPGNTTKFVTKPMIYVVPDAGILDEVIAGFSDTVLQPNLSGGSYSFSDDLIAAQQAALNKRILPDNQYTIRFTSAIRSGEKHSTKLATRTGDERYSYSLSTSSTRLESAEPMTPASAEITGSNNEYLSSGNPDFNIEYDFAIAYLDQITTFYPATRWTNQEFSSADYTWNANGADVINNSDGSITIEGTSTFPVTLELTNDVIGDSFTVTVLENY